MNIGIITYNLESEKWMFEKSAFNSFTEALIDISTQFDIVGWCYFSEDHKVLKKYIETYKNDDIPELVSFGSHLFMENSEFLEAENPYFNTFSIEDKQKFDTWRIRSNAGYMTSEIIQELKQVSFPKSYKVSLAVLGFFAYRLGAIVSVSYEKDLSKERLDGLSDYEYIEAISYFKKKLWIFFFLLSRYMFDKKIMIPLKYIWKNNYVNINHKPNLWDKIADTTSIDVDLKSVDVVIPTLGRADFVFQTLLDLNEQDVKINKVILVEQKLPDQRDTLLSKTLASSWNFEIDHVLLEELGLCNARNIGLQKSNADYIVMFDDDIRIDNQPKILENLIKKLEATNSQIISFASDNKKGDTFSEMSYFVSGCSFLIRNKNMLLFNLEIEGFGSDDQEYNCNVHGSHQRVIYTNQEYINHLRAPMGGWRFDAKSFLPWYDGEEVPLPGPVTLHRYLKYCTTNQLKGYKFFTFFKYYKYQVWKYGIFKKRWKKSLLWANEIIDGNVKIDITKGVLKQ